MINNYKIVKELNKGYSGVAYLVEKNNTQYVIKRQKLLPKEVKPNYKYSIWCEIDFNKFVNKLSKSNSIFSMDTMHHWDGWVFVDEVHLSKEANKRIAQEISNFIVSKSTIIPFSQVTKPNPSLLAAQSDHIQ